MSLASGHHEVRVYGAESILLRPVQLLRDMWREIVASRQLACVLAIRDLKAQYRQSLFGVFWMVVPPIFWAVGLTVAKQNKLITFGDYGSSGLGYSAFVMINMAFWQIFVDALKGPMMALNAYRGVLTRVLFPREAVVMADLIKLAVSVVIQLLLVIGVMLFYRIPVRESAVLFPAALLMLVLLGTALGLLLAPVGLLYKDIGNSLPIVTQIWMFVTPLVFGMPPPSNDGAWATVVRINPVTPMVTTVRELLTGHPLTQLPQFFVVSALCLLAAGVGLAILRATMPLVIERWSA